MASRITSIQHGDAYHDSLNGKALKTGDRVHVKWPSGSIQTVEVRLHCVFIGTLKEGQVVEVPSHKAYFNLKVQGADTKVYLTGWVAQKA